MGKQANGAARHEPQRQDDITDYSLEEALAAAKMSTIGEIRDADLGRQIQEARKNKRSMREFNDKLIEYCTMSESVAASCTYSLPRGGKRVVGPSVRFAELVVVAYKNLAVSTTIVSTEDDRVIVRGSCIDLENNTLTESDVPTRVLKKKTSAKSDDDDKQIALARGSAIARRNAIFAAVPRALWEHAWHESRRTADGKEKSMEAKRAAAIGLYVQEFGATEEQVLAAFGRRGIEELTIDDLRHLRGMVTSIRMGDLTIVEALKPLEAEK
ncbi:MAG TPA: hypothetical protein VM869_23415, partial [Enhygromyxa sp.]|nr:hypothetical protein [Enhygromyxa sp.]